MPCLRFLTDNSLVEEARELAWTRLARRRAFAEPGVQPHYGPDRAFELRHITLELRLDPRRHLVEGRASILVGPTAAGMGVVRLHLDEVQVQEVHGAPRWRHTDGVLELSGLTEETLVTVTWSGSPRHGLYWVGPDPAHPDRRHEVWSQCQDEDAHYFVPCFDHPSVKHPWRVEIVAPRVYRTVGNGRLEGCIDEGEERRWIWVQDEPMPAYLLTVVVAELDVHEDRHGDLPVNYLVPPGTPAEQVQRVFGQTPRMIEVLEGHFGTYPWPRYDQVVVHDFIFGGMENTAATTMTEVLLTTERSAQDYDLQSLVLHELAHQWFGDLLTCQDWSQGWLNEGWATWSEVLWLEATEGAQAGAIYHWGQAQGYFAEADSRYLRPVVSYAFREPIDVFDRHLYEKGACILNTLRSHLGVDAFWSGVRLYLERHRYQTVHTRHFQRALEDATGRNLDGFFQQWVHGAGAPELEVGLAHEEGLLIVSVEQKQEGEQVASAFRFKLRVEATIEGRVQTFDLPVDRRQRSFALPVSAKPTSVRVDPGFRVLSRTKLSAPRDWLLAGLAQDCPVFRIRCARALAEDGSPSALTALGDALHTDPCWQVRAELAELLGKARGEVACAALLASLDQAVSDHSPLKHRRAVVAALSGFDTDAVKERLMACVLEETSLFAQCQAAVSLGQLRSPLVKPAAEHLLAQDSWADWSRAKALVALGASRDPEVLDLLVEHAGPGFRPRIRSAAAEALGQLADQVDSVRLPALDALVDLAHESPFRVRLSAIAALGRVKDPRGAAVLQKLHSSAPDGRTRRMAFEALAEIRDGRSSEAALSGLKDEVERLRREHVALRGRLEKLEPVPDE